MILKATVLARKLSPAIAKRTKERGDSHKIAVYFSFKSQGMCSGLAGESPLHVCHSGTLADSGSTIFNT